MTKEFSRRRFLVSGSAGIAAIALADLHAATVAPFRSARTFVNFASYVKDRSKVDASRAEHQLYADDLREHGQLVTGGPVLGDDGRPSGVLLVYSTASEQDAEDLIRRDPFALHGAFEACRLSEWTQLDASPELLAASLVTPGQRVQSSVPTMRTYINYVKFGDLSQVVRVRSAHLTYLRALKAKGELILAGPFVDDTGALFIYRARSKEDALALAENDPYFIDGAIEALTVSEWRMFGLNADLILTHSNQ